LDSLFEVVAIPPLSISVAVEGASSIDDCCTARGMTPIQLDDGSIYWQACYFCANAVDVGRIRSGQSRCSYSSVDSR
jgi:hypothetical protein